MEKPIPGVYRHFKGHTCVVLGVSKDTETKEEFVSYIHDGQLWNRPLAMFTGTVTRHGKTFPRFVFVDMLKNMVPLIEYLANPPYLKEGT